MSDNDAKPPKKVLGMYRKTEVLTANKETILLLLYAEAIRSMKKAMGNSDVIDTAERARLIVKSQDIVSELRSTLNFQIGEDIAKHLDSLYAFVTERLVKATIDADPKPLQEALNVMTTLESGWREAIEALQKEKAAA